MPLSSDQFYVYYNEFPIIADEAKIKGKRSLKRIHEPSSSDSDDCVGFSKPLSKKKAFETELETIINNQNKEFHELRNKIRTIEGSEKWMKIILKVHKQFIPRSNIAVSYCFSCTCM